MLIKHRSERVQRLFLTKNNYIAILFSVGDNASSISPPPRFTRLTKGRFPCGLSSCWGRNWLPSSVRPGGAFAASCRFVAGRSSGSKHEAKTLRRRMRSETLSRLLAIQFWKLFQQRPGNLFVLRRLQQRFEINERNGGAPEQTACITG